MTYLLDDFMNFLIDKGLVVPGQVFTDGFPDQPDFAVAIYEYTGRTPLPQVAGAFRPTQVVVRSKKVTEARLKCLEIYNALQTEEGILYLTPERWTLLLPNQPPFKMKVDSNSRVYYCFNISITTYTD